MAIPSSRRYSARILCLIAALSVSLAGMAPGAEPAAKQAVDDSVPYDPPVFSYEGGRIDLIEAVRLTLDNDPALLLAEEDRNNRAGVAQEQAGAFDATFSGQLNYEHREQELLESVKQGEIDKRNQLQDVKVLSCDQEQPNLENKIDQLEAARAADTGVPIPADTTFEAQLRVLEALILTEDNEQVLNQLLSERRSLIDIELARTREALADVAQVCQDVTEAIDRLGEVPTEEEFDQASIDLRIEKLTRSGISFAPFVNGKFSSTQYTGKRDGFTVPRLQDDGSPELSPSGIPLTRFIDFGGKNIEDVYTFEVGFDVNIPLLRNRGREAVAAGETAAKIDLEASELLLEHAASESALNTTLAYWNLVGAQERVAALEASVELQERIADITRRLIEGDELPAVEESRSLAGVANARAQLESARRDLVTAQMGLVRAMGLSVEGEESVPNADGGFPSAPSLEQIRALAEAELIRMGLADRLDLASARKLVESGGVLARAAYINLRSRLDLSAGASAISRGEGSVSDSTDKWVAPSYRLGLSLEKPIGNNTAKGRLLQAQAIADQSAINAADLERLVRIGIVRNLGTLAQAVQELEQAQAAADAFEQTVTSEFEKLRLGESTLLDAILTEQQRTTAVLALISARLQIASLIAQLRFETGTIVEREATENKISWASLTTLPGNGS